MKSKTAGEIEGVYYQIIDKIIDHINGILYFGGNKLVIINKKISITSLDGALKIETPAVKNVDRRINTLLSGLGNIVSSIAEMRNANSDAHGVGNRRLNIAEHHARLFVNSAMTMAAFIYLILIM